MKYKIKIEYQTGNSFCSEDETRYIDITWENIDVAKENLRRIKEHYEQYREINSYKSGKNKSIKDILNLNIDKKWFVYKPKLVSKMNGYPINEKTKKKFGMKNCEYVPDEHSATYCLKLKTDEGDDYQLYTFWCGYFEELYSAEIEIDNSDMKIEFN